MSMAAKEDASLSDLDIIEASYRLVADASAFNDVMTSWIDRIDLVDDRQIALLDHPLIVRHLKAVTKLFDQVEPTHNDQVDRAISGTTGPAAVLARDGTVLTANNTACDLWNMVIGEIAETDWIDRHSKESFDSVRRSTEQRGNHRHAILRVSDNGDTSCLAECYVIDSPSNGSGLIAIRALDLNWNEQVASTLMRSFELTDAELEICHLLLDTRDTSQMAQARGTSVHTVRTQLRTIFSKTETATQVDLIRMIALLCTRSSASEGDGTEWIDPLGNEEIFHNANGQRIAYSWMGDHKGRPALLVHGMATGYLLMSDGVQELQRQGIKLYVVSRPSFGSSDTTARDTPIQHAANAIIALAKHLKIESWPAIGHSAGFPPLIRAALDPTARISSIVGAAAYLPYRKSENFKAFPPARKIAFRLARNSQFMADMVGRFCYRMAVSNSTAFLEEHMYSDCAPDREALRNPECAELVAFAGKFMITHQHRAVAGDLRMMASDWSKDLKACPVPIHLLHGEDDPVNRIAEVRAIAANHAGIKVTSFANCGELLYCNHSRRIVKALADMST